MQRSTTRVTSPGRRRVLQGLAGLALGAAAGRGASMGEPLHLRAIPRSGERIPALGMGTWITFNTAPFSAARSTCVEVLRALFAGGGRLVDSSPMYGLAEATLGHCLEELSYPPALFSATKVWIPGRLPGIAQMNASAGLWGVPGFDLMQVHNMLDWRRTCPLCVIGATRPGASAMSASPPRTAGVTKPWKR